MLLRSGCFPLLAVEFLRAYLSRRGYRGTAINNKEPRVNDRIRVPKVRLVGPGGEQVGVVKTEDALRVAVEANLDLVEVAPNSNPPVAKLMDYGKYKYESAQKERAARRNRSNAQLKSIRIGMKIDQNDYNTKKSQAERFLNGGDKVKFDLRFRGREQSRPQLGVELLNGLAEDLAEVSTVESAPRAEGRNMSMVLAPIRKKTEAKSDQRRRREAERETRRQQGAERAKRQQENARANAEARSQQ
nr:translation initiation factor IF-3 [Actinobaculum massiliense]